MRSIHAVEPFYDRLMPELGLPHKRYAFVDARGDWHEPQPDGTYNTVEYYETPQAGRAEFFIGFIEDPTHVPPDTRIAFRVSLERLHAIGEFLEPIGGRHIEPSEDMQEYPAIFFEDPAGTKLEICARNGKNAGHYD
ncbi:MAG: VOC family protein [Vulcanimicrobiaceae bacterium]